MAPCHGWGGLREEKVHLALWREYYRSLPSWEEAKENRLVLGVNIVVWGLKWGSPGSQMADTWPHAMSEVSWENKRCMWQFQECITGPSPLGKRLRKKDSKYWYLGAPMGHGTLPWVMWIERKKRCILQFWESITGPYPLGKWLRKMLSFWG